jgi:arabinogalactan endo-1,4-beta-galactosidase
MKKLLLMLMLITATTMTTACGGSDDEPTTSTQPTPDPDPDPDPEPAEMGRYVGGDISMLTKYEEAGVAYKDKDNKTVQPLTFFKEQGMNAMRVRLFVDPSRDSDKGVCQDLDYVKALGKRIKDAGMAFMLDFHYSDTWADPAKQWTPDAWKNLNNEQLCDKIYEYTKDCLSQLKAAGATPDFIQTGNEISYGMLWGTEGTNENCCYTNSPAANWTRFINLLKKAGQACREECPDAKIIIHSERTPKANVLTDFFDRMKNASLDYDIIGLSYYPAYHGNLATLETALTSLENKNYGKDIMVVETGYSYAWALGGTTYDYTATYPYTEEGQRKFTADLIAKLKNHSIVKGLFWWWPEDNGNKNVTNSWWNAALYDHNTGKPYAAFYELKNFK